MIGFCDEASSLYLHAIIYAYVQNDGSDVAVGCDTSSDDGRALFWTSLDDDWVGLSKAVENRMAEDAQLDTFVKDFVSFLESESIPKVVLRHNGFQEVLRHKVVDKVIHNASIRLLVVDLFVQLTHVQELPATAFEALDDWKYNQGLGNVDNAFFAKAKRVHSIVATLQPLAFNLLDIFSGRDISIERDDGDGLEKFVGSASRVGGLLQLVLCLPVLGRMLDLLRGGVQAAIDDLACSFHLPAINHEVLPPGPDESTTIPNLIAKLFNSAILPSVTKQSLKIFGTTAKKALTTWPGQGVLELAKELLASVPASFSLSISMAPFRVEVANDELWNSAEREMLLQVLGVWATISQIIVALAFIPARCTHDSDIHRDGQLKDDLEQAVSFARTTANLAADLLSKVPASVVAAISGRDWVLPFWVAKAWVSAAQATLTRVASELVGKVAKAVVDVAKKVDKFTPKWDHLITNEKKMNKGLIMKHILGWPSREDLTIHALALFRGISGCSRLCSQWGLGSDALKDIFLKDDLDFADGMWKSARKGMAVIAACNVVFELTGKEKSEGAASLLEKRRDILPDVLIVEFEKRANKN